jgi:hypothetical protein
MQNMKQEYFRSQNWANKQKYFNRAGISEVITFKYFWAILRNRQQSMDIESQEKLQVI